MINDDEAFRVARLLCHNPQRIERLSGGHMNDVFKVHLDPGSPAVLKVGALERGQELLTEGRLLRYFQSTSVDTPTAQLLSTGEPIDIVTTAAGDVAALLVSWIDGKPVRALHDCYLLGQALDRMHAVPAPRFLPRTRILHPDRLPIDGIPTEILRSIDVTALQQALAISDARQHHVTPVLCHGDVSDNSLISTDRESPAFGKAVLFDFEHATVDDALADFAVAVHGVLLRADRPQEAVRSLRRGYLGNGRTCTFTNEELLALTAIAAIRIAQWHFARAGMTGSPYEISAWQRSRDIATACLNDGTRLGGPMGSQTLTRRSATPPTR